MKRNDGCYEIRSSYSKQKTLVVTGIGRSGTTAMIRALYAMGLPQVGLITSATNDDYHIGHAIATNHPDLSKRVASLNAKHEVWGFKYPNMWQHGATLHELREPRLIVMSRDPVAIARRSFDSDQSLSFMRWCEQVSEWQLAMTRFVCYETSMPILFVSYEKLLEKPVTVLRYVSRFTQLPFNGLEEINREDPRYVNGQHTKRFVTDGYDN